MLSLVAIPVSLALGVALLMPEGRGSAFRGRVFFAVAVAALTLVVIGIGAAVSGGGTQLSLLDPLPGIGIGLVATSSGYGVLGLSLCAALLMVAGRDGDDDRLALLLGLLGVAISCLGSSLFTLTCGAEMVVFSALVGTVRGDTAGRHRRWLEAGFLQAAAACLTGAACWYQLEAATTSFNVLPASAGNVASLTWGIGIVLLLAAGVVSASSRGLTYPVAVVGSLVVLNAVRLDQITAALTQASVIPFVAGGCVAGLLSLLQIWRASALRECAHWIWIGTFVPLLFVTAVQDPTAVAMGADVVAVFAAGALLGLAATAQPLGLTRGLATATVMGLPFGPVLSAWVAATAVMATNQPARPLAWVLAAYGVLFAAAGWRIAIRSAEPGLVRGSGNVALVALGSICVAGSLLPGLLAGSLFTWIVDGSATSASAFSLPLAGNGSWPGALIAAIALAATVVFFSAAVILGVAVRRRDLGVDAGDDGVVPGRFTIRAAALWASAGRGFRNLDDWLGNEPRLATVVLAGAVALAVFR
jgi:hypothetical protein